MYPQPVLTYNICDSSSGTLVQCNASMTFGAGRHVDFDIGKLARLSYSPLQSQDSGIRCNACSVNDYVFHCNKEGCGPWRGMSCIVITVHHSASTKVGRCFEYRHVVGVSDENRIESQIQLFGEFIGSSRDKHLGWASGYFVVVAIPAASVIVDGVLQVLRVICVAISGCIVGLYIPVDRIGVVIREKGCVASGSSGVVLLI